MRLVWVILVSFTFTGLVNGLSCPDFKSMNVKISLDDLNTMGQDDIIECLSFFGREELNTEAGTYIWNALISVHGSVAEIPDFDLKQLGWILKSVPVEDLTNFTLNEVDTIAALGQFRNLSEEQLQMLAERVLADWANKGPQEYTHYDLTTLGHILCGFNRSTIEAIHGDAYKEAANSLSLLQGCPNDGMEALASLAQNPEAYGSTITWSSTQLKNIGCIINGLGAHSLNTIPASGFEAITPDIIPCINAETLKSLTDNQLLHLTPSAVAALKPNQKSQLTKEQRKSLDIAYAATENQKSSATKIIFSPICFLILYLAQ